MKPFKFSYYFMLFGPYMVLPVDNLLMPGRKYMGEDYHQLIIEQARRRRLKRAQKSRNERVHRVRKDVE